MALRKATMSVSSSEGCSLSSSIRLNSSSWLMSRIMRSVLRFRLSADCLSAFGKSADCLMASTLPLMSVSGVRNSWDMSVKNLILKSVSRFSMAMSRRSRYTVRRWLKAVKATAAAAMMYSAMAHGVAHRGGSTTTGSLMAVPEPDAFTIRVYRPVGRSR